MMEQNKFTGEGFEIAKDFILKNKEIVVDFFGDNRNWYQELIKGGATYNRISLDSQEEYDKDLNESEEELDLPPLDVSRLTEERSVSVEAFFKENSAAKQAFEEYYKNSTTK